MNMEEAFPNLEFVGKGVEEFKKKEITEEQLEAAKEWGEKGETFGKRFMDMMNGH